MAWYGEVRLGMAQSNVLKEIVDEVRNKPVTTREAQSRYEEAGMSKRKAKRKAKELGANWWLDTDIIDMGMLAQARNNLIRALKGNMPVGKALSVYKKYVPVLLVWTEQNIHVMSEIVDRVDEVDSGSRGNARRRWSEEDDDMLIELASDGVSISTIAFSLRRSPSAIQSRISHLVGIQKLTQEVAGRFIGQLDGKHIEGDISGTVTKNR
jgi:hypothetical protein